MASTGLSAKQFAFAHIQRKAITLPPTLPVTAGRSGVPIAPRLNLAARCPSHSHDEAGHALKEGKDGRTDFKSVPSFAPRTVIGPNSQLISRSPVIREYQFFSLRPLFPCHGWTHSGLYPGWDSSERMARINLQSLFGCYWLRTELSGH